MAVYDFMWVLLTSRKGGLPLQRLAYSPALCYLSLQPRGLPIGKRNRTLQSSFLVPCPSISGLSVFLILAFSCVFSDHSSPHLRFPISINLLSTQTRPCRQIPLLKTPGYFLFKKCSIGWNGNNGCCFVKISLYHVFVCVYVSMCVHMRTVPMETGKGHPVSWSCVCLLTVGPRSQEQ